MKYLAGFILVLILASCHNYKRDAEQLQQKVDSLKTVAEHKDSTIEIFLYDFNEIQANLDSIKILEEMIDMNNNQEQGLNRNQKQRILSDIEAINGLLQENKELIASLRQRINSSSVKSNKLQAMVDDLEELSKSLEQNLQQKDAQIAELSEKVEQQNQNITQLSTQIQQMENMSTIQYDSIKYQEAELNKAYYTVGSVSELKDQGVVERQGGILGIGSTPVISEDFTEDYFKQVDIREFDYLPLDSRKAELVSVHPVDSYHITGDNRNADTLYVDNPEEFWSASKYLVIATK